MADLEILLQEYRNQIETIDKEIIYLLSRRQNLSESIGHIKEAL
jgi:chorismate mutase